MYAVKFGTFGMVKILVENGAIIRKAKKFKVTADMIAKNPEMQTYLHEASLVSVFGIFKTEHETFIRIRDGLLFIFVACVLKRLIW